MKIKRLIKLNLMRAAMTLALIMTCATAWAQTTQSVTYIDENGQPQTVNATQIPSENLRMYPDTWYYVSGTVNCPDDNLYLMQQNCTHNLILCDGATLTVQQVEQLNDYFAKLRIFGQSGGTGKLNVGTGNMMKAIYNCDFALYGGEVTLTYSSTWGYGTDKNVDFNGGKLTATSGANGIGGNTTINATSGWIKASKYGGSVTIAEGKYMKDETGRCYKGTLTDAEKAAVAGKTLQPATQTEYISYIFGGGNGSQNSPYLIGSTESWNYFCDALLDNNTWNHFSGKYVKLGANISITQSAGSAGHEFMGTFDGDGKTLTFNYGSEGTPSNEDYIAPFRYTDGATISGLHVSGNIYTQHTHSAGIIGLASGTTTVSNCRSSINIISSINGDGTHGGLIACTWTGSTTNITGCLFDGSIQSASGYATDQCGGFVGWRNNTINVTNSLLTADLSTIGDGTGNYPSCTFVRSGVSSITNSYYTAALGTVQGKLRHSITAGANTTVANAGTATTYDVSGITSYGTGILYDGVLYAGNGDAVSLTLTHQDPPEGYTFNSYIPSAGTLNGTTLTMPDEDVTISAPWAPISYAITYNLEGGNLPTGQSNPESYTIESNDIELVNPIKSGYNFVGWTGTGLNGPTQTVIIAHGSMGIREYTAIWSVSVNYINENGVEQTVTALPLTGSETTLDPGWYVVENTNPNGVDLAYTEGLSCSGGDLNLILCDGAEMTVTGAYTYDAITLDGAYTLTIYGQSQQSGKLTLTGSEYGKCIQTNDGNIVINGGIVNATADTDGAIKCNSFTMNGGSFSATSNSSYDYDHAIQISDSFTFNGGNFSAIATNPGQFGIEGAWSPANLSWTNSSDSFYVSSLGQVSINIAEGKDFIDDENNIHTSDEPGDIAGKTLRPFYYYSPKNLTVTGITLSSAMLTWEAGNNETQWQVSWSTDGGSTWSDPVTVNNEPQYEITNLNPETTVQVQVKSIYSEGQSFPTSITFTTRSLCDAPESLTAAPIASSATLNWAGYQDSYNVRYCELMVGDAVTTTEDFEHDGEMPEGWTKLDLGDGENTAKLGISEDAAQNGTYGFRFSSYDGDSDGSFDQYLISPELYDITALSFAYKSSNGSTDVFRVGYSTTTNDVSAFTWGDVINSVDDWTVYSENANNIPANAKYFAINYTAVWQYYLYIDDITYTCRPFIAGAWNETNTNVTSPLTISGLTPETPYAWQVQGSNCDGNNGTTEWSEMGTFTTQPLGPVIYIDENGVVQYKGPNEYTLLEGSTEFLQLPGGWYVVNGNISYNYMIEFQADTYIILCDGSQMTFDCPSYGIGLSSLGDLTLYGQSAGTGTINATVNNDYHSAGIWANNVVINGGTIIANSINGGELTCGIYSSNTVTINGGKVTANSTGIGEFSCGIYAGNNITLGWRNASDFIHASTYYYSDGSVNIAEGKAFIDDENNIYNSGTVNASAIDGKTLQPAVAVTLSEGITAVSGIIDNYAKVGETVTVSATAPLGYTVSGINYTPEGGEATAATDLGNGSWSFTVPTANVSVSAALQSTGLPVSVTYMNADGTTGTHYAIALDGTETVLGAWLEDKWYFVGIDINVNHQVTIGQCDVHLILCNGKSMNFGTSSSPIGNEGFYYGGSNSAITIYGQTLIDDEAGSLNIYSNRKGFHLMSSYTQNSGNVTISVSGFDKGMYANTITINGGRLIVSNSRWEESVYSNSNIYINGGKIQATSSLGACYDIQLGWTNPDDYIYANSYQIGTGHTVTIAEGKAFKVYDGETLESVVAGTLNSAQIAAIAGKTLHPLLNAVARTVEGYNPTGTGTDDPGKWVFISSPVSGSIAPSEVYNLFSSAGATSNDYDLYRFNQSDDNGKEWQNFKATSEQNHPDFTSLVNGHGYLYATKETKTLVFSGTFNTNETMTVDLDYTEGQGLAGWNLVGNPFAVDAYVNRPFYQMNADGTGIEPIDTYNNYTTPVSIPACTGIMVQAGGEDENVVFSTSPSGVQNAPNRGNLQIALNQVVEAPGSDSRFASLTNVESDDLRGTKQSTIDKAIVSFNEGSKLGKFYFGTQNANIYIPQNNEEYAIAFSEGQGEMPLNFKANENGTYTISVNPENVEMAYLHLIDNLTGANIDLLQTPSYTFTAKTTDYASRFKLVFVCGDADGDNNTFAFYSNGNWVISNEGEATLQVMDVNGRVLSSETINGSVGKAIHGAAGVYVIRLINGENVKVQKIVVK